MYRYNPLRAIIFFDSLHIVLVFLCLLIGVATLPTQNINIEVPDGTTDHGDPHLLCTPTKWTDIAAFFLLNFFAHAATVVIYPGESANDVIVNVVMAIIFPASGAMRGLNAIMRHSAWGTPDSLQQAVQSGALCMVVRSPSWRPERGDVVTDAWCVEAPASTSESTPMLERGRTASGPSDTTGGLSNTTSLETYIPYWVTDVSSNWSYSDTSSVYVTSRVVFGSNELPKGYKYAFVPRKAKVVKLSNSTSPKLSSSYGMVQAAAGLLQLMYGIFTLYRARGDQIRRYGYAAFGLTVIPYAVMSTSNLVAKLFTPNYSTLYLVSSEVMDEAKQHGGLFDQVVGRIEPPVQPDIDLLLEGRVGWSKITDSFEETNDQLHISSPHAEPLTVVSETSATHRTVYVPICPQFQRTDNVQSVRDLRRQQPPPRRQQRSELTQQSKDRLLLNPEIDPKNLDTLPFFVVLCIEIIILGVLSGFHPGDESTSAQRSWMIIWYCWGCVLGFSIALINSSDGYDMAMVKLGVSICLCAPSVGGFVVVGQMLKAYGSCVRFD